MKWMSSIVFYYILLCKIIDFLYLNQKFTLSSMKIFLLRFICQTNWEKKMPLISAIHSFLIPKTQCFNCWPIWWPWQAKDWYYCKINYWNEFGLDEEPLIWVFFIFHLLNFRVTSRGQRWFYCKINYCHKFRR